MLNTPPASPISAEGVPVDSVLTPPDIPTSAPPDPIEALAHRLAAEQIIFDGERVKPLLADQLHAQSEFLVHAYRIFNQIEQTDTAAFYAAEWLLDNFSIIQEAIRQIEEDLPPNYYRQLPKLKNTAWRNYPRMYALAYEVTTLLHSQLILPALQTFLQVYQADDHGCTIGELWAFPTMLRLAVLDRLTQTLKTIMKMIMPGISPQVSAASAAQTAEEDDLIGYCITSLRMIAAQDWKEFFESVSRVEHILRSDPAGIYPQMDFESRNSYRTVIERVANRSHHTEETVANHVVILSQNKRHQVAPDQNNQSADPALPEPVSREAHVGYYLIDEGSSQLELTLGYHPNTRVKANRWLFDHPTSVYLGGIVLLTAIIVAVLVAYATVSHGNVWQLLAAGLLGLIPATAVAVSLVNWLITTNVPPRRLPRLHFEKGIPADCQSMVVIPTLLTSSEETDSLLQQLELHYLRNPDPSLTFALLTDFADAPAPHMPADADLVDRIVAGINALNARYARSSENEEAGEPLENPATPFYLFHRERRWNPKQNCWMGWERKRGKLVEFNRLLRPQTTGSNGISPTENTSYTVQIGDLSILPHIKYVITLDADTLLPEDSAQRLISAIAHPLNRAVIDPARHKVIAGYGILQPRTEIKPTSAIQSAFARIFSGDTGMDLYTHAVSDVYQDFFGTGSYVGKGIYDVDTFIHCLADRVPENALLSHDLFEGSYVRVGLLTDTQLLEEYPAQYLAHTRRLHRWIRGDWQLLPWLMADQQRTTFSTLDRWKILDNLRRSLVIPALLLYFAIAWIGLPGSALIWTLIGVVVFGVSLITNLFGILINGAPDLELREKLEPLRLDVIRWLLALAFLPYETWLALSAIGVTLIRLFITHRNLLEWVTAAQTTRLFARSRGKPGGALAVWAQMWINPVIALAFGVAIAILHPAALIVALPLLILWLITPQIVYVISRPLESSTSTLTADQEVALRHLARQTWLFFEYMVGPEDHWLPPDHFQESPASQIAHRTSPTNIGLLILSSLAAYDLGYTGKMDLIARLRATFETLGKLERYRGHFLNWYNTQTLDPLNPRYVSTVDSGNLAGALIAMSQTCRDLPEFSVLRGQRWQGLLDTLLLLDSNFKRLQPLIPPEQLVLLTAQSALVRIEVEKARQSSALQAEILAWLTETGSPELSRLILTLIDSDTPLADSDLISDLRISSNRIYHHLTNMQRDMNFLAPWQLAMRSAPAMLNRPDLDPALIMLWQQVKSALPAEIPALAAIEPTCDRLLAPLQALADRLKGLNGATEGSELAYQWCARLIERLHTTKIHAEDLLAGCEELAAYAEAYFREMDFGFLYDPSRQLFRIGFNVDTGRLDDNFYDLLASEARLASFLAIAKRDVPQSHWLHMGRPVTKLGNRRLLLSWSGTMFEYLMPTLLMESYDLTFLTQSCREAVAYQIAYSYEQRHSHEGEQASESADPHTESQKLPWGVSEAGYYAFGGNSDYQYRAFGVPGLGFKRGLGDDLVITPYASVLALRYEPLLVRQNIDQLDSFGMRGRYGFYEALDFTRSRLPIRQDHAIVKSYMAHHQGMILLSLANYLTADLMIRRFHADPRVQSVELLLQEKIPEQAPAEYPNLEQAAMVRVSLPQINTAPWPIPAESIIPLPHVLSNGRYSTLITNAGTGYSFWQGTGLTRWQPDTTLDNQGQWLYVQDLDSSAFWSATMQPIGAIPESQQVLFSPHQVEFQRRDNGIGLTMQITVSPDDDVEIRRVTLVNQGDQPRKLRLISYAEVLLAAPAERHPAFNRMFVESEYAETEKTLIFHRRPRTPDEAPIYMGHVLIAPPESSADASSDQTAPISYETDRGPFIGRGNSPRTPDVLIKNGSLTGTVGATLDPIMALAQTITLAPHATAKIAYLTVAAPSRDQILSLARQYQVWPTIDSAFDKSRYQNAQALQRVGLDSESLAVIQQLLAAILYPYSPLQAAPEILAANSKGAPGLWAYAVSGDFPILLVQIEDNTALGLIQELLRAHNYWRNQQLTIDLVILNLHDSSYSQELREQIHRLIARTDSSDWLNRRGGIFVLNADQMGDADRILLQTAARAVLDGRHGSLADQVARLRDRTPPLPAFVPTLRRADLPAETPPASRPADLMFDNGLGGFTADGTEYVITLQPGQWTPAPWVNVIANADFGCLVSEAGSGYTWATNSGENRLTPWTNDPLSDTPGEALYLRDEETAIVWSPTPLPARDDSPYLIRHGAGYSIFEHDSQGLHQETQILVAPDAPVKIVKVRLTNTWDRPRRITITYYVEWILGVSRAISQPHIVTEFDHDTGALLARNPYNTEFADRVAFVAASKAPHGMTSDRTEFLGRQGSYRQPAALTRIGLASTIGAGFDPCAVQQLHVDLPIGASEEVFFLIGEGTDTANALELIRQYRDPAQVKAALQATHAQWDRILNTISVKTPDPAMNLMLNRWLLYQALTCRIWGRSALYQSSGAFGYRDQLQDVMSVLHAAPQIARAQILNAAQRQFEAGDVLHWWHPPSGRGVRTRIVDDMLWLPFVTAQYVEVTGDSAILDEKLPFLKADPLKPDETERYAQYPTTDQTFTLYEHCLRALRRGSTKGSHGLPLMGTGDWNDGLNLVGAGGRGESVWMGWFLYSTLTRFAAICEQRSDSAQAEGFHQQAQQLQTAIEASAWDGNWYRRAWFDDGTPLGAARNSQAQIDSIAQSWAVLSGAGRADRTQQAIASAIDKLVRNDDRLILLLTPPFDAVPNPGQPHPGYIQGYPPGIRENGGQYTHGALWLVWALAQMGRGDDAVRLFQILNPVSHSDTADKVARYRVEPYVVVADVYSVDPHVGRGGWTWYTGSAAWMYRVGIEAILGIQRSGQTLRIVPHVPKDWPGYDLTYRDGDTTYAIHVRNSESLQAGTIHTTLDGQPIENNAIPLTRDGQTHQVQIE